MSKTVTLSKGGKRERKIQLDQLVIPDCWHSHLALKHYGEEAHAAAVLECWHMAHDLARELRECSTADKPAEAWIQLDGVQYPVAPEVARAWGERSEQLAQLAKYATYKKG